MQLPNLFAFATLPFLVCEAAVLTFSVYLVGRVGIEPTMILIAAINPKLVNREGIEPLTHGLKAHCRPSLTLRSRYILAGLHGFEPRYTESKSAVLPLDDSPIKWCAEKDSNLHGQGKFNRRRTLRTPCQRPRRGCVYRFAIHTNWLV